MHKVKHIAGRISPRPARKQESANTTNTMDNSLDPIWLKQRLEREWMRAEHAEHELVTVMEERDVAQDQIKTLQAAVDRYGRMLLEADKELCRLKAEAEASRDALAATEHQLKMATEWLKQGAHQLQAGTEMTTSLQEKYQELLGKHTHLMKLLEDVIPKAGQAVNSLNTAVPESMQRGRMTVECVSGVYQAVELLKVLAALKPKAAVSPRKGNTKSWKDSMPANKRTTSNATAVPMPQKPVAKGPTKPLTAPVAVTAVETVRKGPPAAPAPPADMAEDSTAVLFTAEAVFQDNTSAGDTTTEGPRVLPPVAVKLNPDRESSTCDDASYTPSSVQDLLSTLVGDSTPKSSPDAANDFSSTSPAPLQRHTSLNLAKNILSQALRRPARSEQNNGSSNGFLGSTGRFPSQWAQSTGRNAQHEQVAPTAAATPDLCTQKHLDRTPSPRAAERETEPTDNQAKLRVPLDPIPSTHPADRSAAQEASQGSPEAPAATCSTAVSKATGTATDAVGTLNPLCSLSYASLATSGNNDRFLSCGGGSGLFTTEALYTCASICRFATGSWAWWQCLLGGACSIALDSCMHSKTTMRTVAVLMAALVVGWTLLCLRIMWEQVVKL